MVNTRLNKFVALALCGLLIAACTPYRSIYDNFSNMGGYYEQEKEPAVYVVGFRGNGWIDPSRVRDYALLRVMELGEERGYTHVQVLSSRGSFSGSTWPRQEYDVKYFAEAVPGVLVIREEAEKLRTILGMK